jgi:chromosome segregation ATPase
MSATVNILQKKIEELESQLKKVRQSKTTAEDQLADLQGKRKGYVLQACIGDDTEARKSRSRTDSEIGSIERDLSAYSEAIHEISGEIEQRKADLVLAEWEVRRDRVRSLVAARVSGAGERHIAELTEQLKKAFEELAAGDQQIREELLKFEPKRLRSEAAQVYKFSELRGDRVATMLWRSPIGPLLPINLSAQMMDILQREDLGSAASQAFKLILEAIDQLEA